MLILQGFVKGVLLKNEDVQDKNTYAVVGIEDISQDRDGFDVTTLRKIMVAGEDFKKGLHNAYRSLQGTEVYAPVNVRAEIFNNKPQERYTLAGPPIRLEAARPAQTPAAVKSA